MSVVTRVLFSLIFLMAASGPNVFSASDDLRHAVLSDSEKLIRALLTGSTNQKDLNELMDLAAEAGHGSMVKVLKELGAEIGNNALLLATQNGRAGALQALIKEGVAIDVVDKNKRSALTLAAMNRDFIMVRDLLQAGANPNIYDIHGNHALYYAVFQDHAELVRLLAHSGSESHAGNEFGESVLTVLQAVRDTNAYRHVMGIKPRQRTLDVLYESLLTCDLRVLKAAIANGRDPNWATRDGRSALMFAAHNGDTAAVAFLLESKADVNATDRNGKTALMFAVSRGRTEVVKQLIAAEAEVNAVTLDRITPLRIALENDDEAVSTLLVRAGANILAQRADGTPVRLKASKLAFNRSRKQLKKLKMNPYSFDDTFPLSDSEPVYVKNRLEYIPPIFRKLQEPKYTEAAIRASARGKVRLEARFGRDGIVYNIRILETDMDWAHGLELEAVKALGQWEFTPGKRFGTAAGMRMQIDIDFKWESFKPVFNMTVDERGFYDWINQKLKN